MPREGLSAQKATFSSCWEGGDCQSGHGLLRRELVFEEAFFQLLLPVGEGAKLSLAEA